MHSLVAEARLGAFRNEVVMLDRSNSLLSFVAPAFVEKNKTPHESASIETRLVRRPGGFGAMGRC